MLQPYLENMFFHQVIYLMFIYVHTKLFIDLIYKVVYSSIDIITLLIVFRRIDNIPYNVFRI